MQTVYTDGWVKVVVTDHNPIRGNRGEVEVKSRPFGPWQWYYPLPGDAETQRMIELCAGGLLPPALLADRIGEVEPADAGSEFGGFTAALRTPGLEEKGGA